MVTLSQALADCPQPVSLIKIDVEGAELAAIKGLEAPLAESSPKPLMVIEFGARA